MTRPSLLDVNVLVALVWPNHIGHGIARSWFAEHSINGWATTPITESGLVRISSNRRALKTATSPALALEMLGRLCQLPGHVFWSDAVQMVMGGGMDPNALSGHRQITDAHLLALARAHGGQLVTFDRATVTMPDAENDVLLLGT